ncbi:MAG TPA: DUF2269 family protein [Woeseiaceae bacterium]|jgi:uncharacterized membrane protein|nr:DUF2269 family protein [Woeseiaceae bacterium]
MDYLIWKLVHVVSVIMFVGNITTGVFWAAHAVRSEDFALIASTFDGIIRADRRFTTPGVVGLTIGGIAAAISGGLPILGTGWILWGIVLLLISGAAFGMRVAPLQREILRLAREGDAADEARQTFRRCYASWQFWGTVALLTPLIAVVLMVLKPGLPGL